MNASYHFAAAQATGCADAGGYIEWSARRGYLFVEVVDWTSSAGDWTFLVSKDGRSWRVLYQENRHPRGRGFERELDPWRHYEGTANEALAEASAELEE